MFTLMQNAKGEKWVSVLNQQSKKIMEEKNGLQAVQRHDWLENISFSSLVAGAEALLEMLRVGLAEWGQNLEKKTFIILRR